MDALDLVEFPDELTKLSHQMIGGRQDIEQLSEARDIADKSTLENAKRIDAHWRASLIMHLANLTLLIDAKLISIDQAAERIEQIQTSLAEKLPGYADPMVKAGLKHATDWLQSHKKRPWRVIQGGLSVDDTEKS